MKLITRCQSCNKKNLISFENAEKTLKCGHCGEKFKNGVIEVVNNDATFIDDKFRGILLFYTDTCPHCVGVKESFRKLSKIYEEITFVQINATDNQYLSQKYRIKGVPNMFLIKNGETIETIPGAVNEYTLKEYLKKI